MGLKGVHVAAVVEDAEKFIVQKESGKVRRIVLAANTCWRQVRLPLSRKLWRKLLAD
jgi:hypothetical protein